MSISYSNATEKETFKITLKLGEKHQVIFFQKKNFFYFTGRLTGVHFSIA